LDGAGIYIEPRAEEIVRALEQMFSSEERRLRMAEQGLRAASRLTWDHAARQLMDVIHPAGDPAS
jgi:glycosyltransferase involved in cell wall biosynthesis